MSSAATVAGIQGDVGGAKTVLVEWLQASDDGDKLRLFQAIDSIVMHFMRTGTFESAESFPFWADIAGVVSFAWTWLQFLPPHQLFAEIQSLCHLRPPGNPLPTLFPSQANNDNDATPQPGSAQPSSSVASSALAQPGGSGQADPAHSQPPLAQLIGVHQHAWVPLVQDRDHSRRLDAEYLASNNKFGFTNVPDCVDYPRDRTAELARVRALFEKMVDFTTMVDKPLHKKAGGKRTFDQFAQPVLNDNAAVRRVKAAPSVVLINLAFKMVAAVKDAQDGNVFIAPYQGPAVYEQYDSFSARWAKIEEAFKDYKATIDNCMTRGDSYIRRLAAAPGKEYTRKQKNSELNGKRQKTLEVGRELERSASHEVAPVVQAQTTQSQTTQAQTIQAQTVQAQTFQAQTFPAQTVQALASPHADPLSTVNFSNAPSVPGPFNTVGSYHGHTGAPMVSDNQYEQAYPGQSSDVPAYPGQFSNVHDHAGEMFSQPVYVPEAPRPQAAYSQAYTGQSQVGNYTGYYPVPHNTQQVLTEQSQQFEIDPRLTARANDNNDFFPDFVNFQDD